MPHGFVCACLHACFRNQMQGSQVTRLAKKRRLAPRNTAMDLSLLQALKEKQEKQEYLNCLKTGMDEEAFAIAAASRKEEMLKLIHETEAVGVAEATAILKQLNVGPFPDESKKALTRAVNGKASTHTSTSSPPNAKRAPLQKHVHMHHYLSEGDWEVIQNTRLDFNTKTRTLIQRMATLGIKNPSEGKYVHITALLYLGAHSGAPNTLQVKPTDAYATLRDLKCVMKGWRVKVHVDFTDYPHDVKEFKKAAPAVYAAAYADGEPVKCKIDESAIDALRAQIPARKTHAAVGTTSASSMGSPSVMPRDTMFQQMLGQMLLKQATTDQIPGLTILPTPQRSRPQRSQGRACWL